EPRRRLALADQGLDPERAREDGAHPHDEHDGVADLPPGRQLAERVDDDLAPGKGREPGRSERANGFGSAHGDPHRAIWKCSTIGPGAGAGTNVSAPTRRPVDTRSTTNGGPSPASVPGPAGIDFFAAIEPAIARTATAGT